MNKWVAALAFLLPFSVYASPEVWHIKWMHVFPVNHPTRNIVFTETNAKKKIYAVLFDNGVKGTVELTFKKHHVFTGKMVLKKSKQLPDGDICALKGTVLNRTIQGTWHCESKHQGTLIGESN